MKTCNCGQPADGLDDERCQMCREDLCVDEFWKLAPVWESLTEKQCNDEIKRAIA